MKEYTRRNWPVLAMLSRGGKPPVAQEETELTLHLSKKELFDRHVLLPHAEVNECVYSAVNQFVER